MNTTIASTEGNPRAAAALTAADLTPAALTALAHALEPTETDLINAGTPIILISHCAVGLGWKITTTVALAIRTADGREAVFDYIGDPLTVRRFDGREALTTVRWSARKILPAIVAAGVPVVIEHSEDGRRSDRVEYAPAKFPAGRTKTR